MDIAMTVVLFLPFLLVLWLANLAEHARAQGNQEGRRTLALISYGLLALLITVAAVEADQPLNNEELTQ